MGSVLDRYLVRQPSNDNVALTRKKRRPKKAVLGTKPLNDNTASTDDDDKTG